MLSYSFRSEIEAVLKRFEVFWAASAKKTEIILDVIEETCD
jgi:hypothetical protein